MKAKENEKTFPESESPKPENPKPENPKPENPKPENPKPESTNSQSLNSQSPEPEDPSDGPEPEKTVWVCQYQSCDRSGSAEVLEAFRQAQLPPGTRVESSGCMGQCSSGPTVRVSPDRIWYCRVKPSDVEAIVEEHLERGKPIDRLLNPRIHLRFYY
ncbi:MAG: (2Fe-2S) ferredoxin domain-containing protein [Oscillatoria sp. SIO1A7]|nr:(2Fe-2S) ferredoxin domain-containing protein [Oscillatoria sp. SIO1A7]